jgi:hypothetical protein
MLLTLLVVPLSVISQVVSTGGKICCLSISIVMLHAAIFNIKREVELGSIPHPHSGMGTVPERNASLKNFLVKEKGRFWRPSPITGWYLTIPL